MKLHLYGLPENPKMLLIHGVLMPWQIWEPQIQYYKEKYHVLVVELDGHTQDKPSRFVSAETEAQKIEKYCEDREITSFAVVCGLSLGGVIAQILWRNQKLQINQLILDGAPLIPSGRIAMTVMTRVYLNLVHKSQKRDPKILENLKKNFIPETYMDAYLADKDALLVPRDYEKHCLAPTLQRLQRFAEHKRLIPCSFEMDEGSFLYLEERIQRALEAKPI